MDHHPLPVLGYTDQDSARINRVNRHKVMEEEVLRVMDLMAGDNEFDQRWLAVARTHIEQGFMALNRAVFRPQRLPTLPDV